MTSRRIQLMVVVAVLALAVGSASCGKVSREGSSPAYLVIDSLTGSRGGASSTTPTPYLESDVVTVVNKIPTVFEDAGTVTLHLAMKNPGDTASPTEPSSLNLVTVSRYHVEYVRTDGRNTPGVDVPYAFDGALTGTITKASSSLSFILVRVQAKMEAPLQALKGGGGAVAIMTLANVTFYGKDQAGNEVTVTGQLTINFADWGDPS